jgi:hypothetical protein
MDDVMQLSPILDPSTHIVTSRILPPRQKEVNPLFIDFEIIGDVAQGTDYLSYERIRVVEFDLVPEIQHVSKEVNPTNQRFHQGKRK